MTGRWLPNQLGGLTVPFADVVKANTHYNESVNSVLPLWTVEDFAERVDPTKVREFLSKAGHDNPHWVPFTLDEFERVGEAKDSEVARHRVLNAEDEKARLLESQDPQGLPERYYLMRAPELERALSVVERDLERAQEDYLRDEDDSMNEEAEAAQSRLRVRSIRKIIRIKELLRALENYSMIGIS